MKTKSIFNTIYVYRSNELIDTITCNSSKQTENKYNELLMNGYCDVYGRVIEGVMFKMA